MITGGATGVGLETAIDLGKAGAEVIIGTRSQKHFEAAAVRIGIDEVIPFIADLTDFGQIRNAVSRIYQDGKVPTDVVLSAAGGMEPFMEDLMRGLVRLKKCTGEEFDLNLESLKERIRGWVATSWDYAARVNLAGPRFLIRFLSDFLPYGSRVIFYSSLPSTFVHEVAPPGFYKNVALSKWVFEQFFESQSSDLIKKGVYPAIVSGHIVAESNVGRITERYLLPLLPEEEREGFRASFITAQDMIQATRMLLGSDPKVWQVYPKRLYVIRPGVIVSNLSTDDSVFSFRSPI